MRNRTSAIKRRIGSTVTMAETRHRLRLFSRSCLRRAISGETAYNPELYSFSHCFTMIPIVAEARLKTMLVNHRAFSHMVYRGGWKGGKGRSKPKEGDVEFTKGELILKLESWTEICISTATV